MPAAAPKRPLYLVFALLGALLLGTVGLRDGWGKIALYREAVDLSSQGDGISSEADRQLVVGRAREYVEKLDAAKRTGWPLGVATLVLGGAVFFFAMRTLSGGSGARAVLVQLVVAQAATNVASAWLLRDVSSAELRYAEATYLASLRDGDRSAAADVVRRLGPLLESIPPALGTLCSALVVIGLTRPRSRELLDPTSQALGER